MLEKITLKQWEYLGKPNGICILHFKDKNSHINAPHWVDTIWRIPWEVLCVDVKKENNVIPRTIVTSDVLFEKFFHPHGGMAGKFEADWRCEKYFLQNPHAEGSKNGDFLQEFN